MRPLNSILHTYFDAISFSFVLPETFKCHYYFATHQKGSENEIANTSRNYPLGVSMKNGSLGLKSNSFYLLFEWREKKSNAQPVIMYNNIIVNKNGVALPLSKSFAHIHTQTLECSTVVKHPFSLDLHLHVVSWKWNACVHYCSQK